MHPVTAPAMQRAQRLLDQRVTPRIRSGAVDFEIHSAGETFESPGYVAATSGALTPFALGGKWGRAWHTHWFRATITVPSHLNARHLVAYFDLGFTGRGDGFQVEAMAWRDGRIVHAIQPDRRLIDLGVMLAGESVELWIEAAATPIIAGHEYGYGPTTFGDPATAPAGPIYTFRAAQLAEFHTEMNSFALDLHATINLVLDLPADSSQRARLFAALERCDTAFDVAAPYESVERAHAEIRTALANGAGATSHTVTAVGHAHLDTAWLWPIRETRRKARRTFANAVHLLEQNPDMVYCHSQAQHYAWVAEDDPELFARVTELVHAGRWEPVGGMWVETDLNLPSGESLLRQLVQGQRAFEEWFGHRSRVAFLPDDFGYPGGLPQIVAHGGCEFFFTQKLSWNETNKFPHHSFWWEGIDGTTVFAHFSPIDTYNALMLPSQLRFAERNFADHAGASHSLVLYGHGDGGGGPTQAMIDRARLTANLENVPRVRFGTVEGFFETACDEYRNDAPRWVGEMYFEKHRGTYSTQLGTKQGNRSSERLLHELELWSASARRTVPGIDDLWRRVLTQQFHDIIPGSSIAWVHKDAEDEHRGVATACEACIDELIGSAKTPLDPTTTTTWVMNPAPVRLRALVDNGIGHLWCDVPPMSVAPASTVVPASVPAVTSLEGDTTIQVSNGHVTFEITIDGRLTVIEAHGRNLIPHGSHARLEMRSDTPAEYDAWDIDRVDADSPPLPVIEHVRTDFARDSNDARTVIESTYRTTDSSFTIRYILRAGAQRLDIELDANWQEAERRLQWVVPTDLLARDALCGTQFGHVRRARHGNTSWDHARFEVCAHRWIAVAEPTFAAAILADGPRGYDVRGQELKLTLLRSPRFPDPAADIGDQRISWSVMLLPGDPLLSGIEEEAALIAHPPRLIDHEPSLSPLGISLDVSGALVSAVKNADDASGDLIVRVWETRGSRTSGRLVVGSLGTRVDIACCNALEEPTNEWQSTGVVSLKPFEIQTLRIRR